MNNQQIKDYINRDLDALSRGDYSHMMVGTQESMRGTLLKLLTMLELCEQPNIDIIIARIEARSWLERARAHLHPFTSMRPEHWADALDWVLAVCRDEIKEGVKA